MNKIFKLAMLAIFLINNGWAAANQLEANEASFAGQEHNLEARAAGVAGVACYPGDCCSAYRLYVGETLYPVQETAPGTVCKAGSIVHIRECDTPCSLEPTKPTKAPSTAAPTQRPVNTQAPTQKATEKPTEKPTERPTERPTEKPTEKPTPRPPTQATQRPVNTPAPTQKATEKPTERPTEKPTEKPTERPTEKPTSAPTEKPTSAPTEKPTSAPTTKPTVAPTTKPTTPPPAAGLCDVVPTAQEPLKFLVPLYVFPSSGKWDIVAAGASKVPTVAIVNPNNGPTAKPSSSYQTGMDKLEAGKAEMVGYVYTSYADRPVADAKKDIDTWVANWPQINGIFFDEASSKAADVPYYRELYNHVISKGYKHVILNPGTQPDKGYLDISTNIVIFESYGDKFATKKYESWVKCAPNASAKAGYKYKFTGIAHSISGNTASTTLIKEMEKSGIGMVYITDGTPADSVYDPLPTYYNAQVSDIQKINQL